MSFGAHAAGSSNSTAKASVAGGEEKKEASGGDDGTPEDGVDQKATKELGFADTKAKEQKRHRQRHRR